MRVLLAQLSNAQGDDVEDDVRRVSETLTHHPEVDLAVFPELFLGGYALDRVHVNAQPLDAPELRRIGEAAATAQTAVIIGFPECVGNRVANAAACFCERGQLRTVYRKIQLFGNEVDFFSPGDTLTVTCLAGRRVGVLICFDAEFPELARSLAVAGTDLLVTISANMAPYYMDHRLISRARAIDNRLPHIYVNSVGVSGGHQFVGGSRIITSDGSVTAEADSDAEIILTGDIQPAQRPSDISLDYLALLPSQPRIVTD